MALKLASPGIFWTYRQGFDTAPAERCNSPFFRAIENGAELRTGDRHRTCAQNDFVEPGDGRAERRVGVREPVS